MPIAILGPTASGKSALATVVARRVGGTVVNGDPFQAIQGLAIGTGQPGEDEQDGVPHVGYGVLPLSTRPNPTAFGASVRAWLSACREPVLVTGSGLYLRGIWEQLSDLPEVAPALVHRVRHWVPASAHRFFTAIWPPWIPSGVQPSIPTIVPGCSAHWSSIWRRVARLQACCPARGQTFRRVGGCWWSRPAESAGGIEWRRG